MNTKCYHCGFLLNTDHDYFRQSSCHQCQRSTHCCKNCVYYDVSKYNECAENSADRVTDKEKANFCDYFKPSNQAYQNGNQGKSSALAAAEALFKKK